MTIKKEQECIGYLESIGFTFKKCPLCNAVLQNQAGSAVYCDLHGWQRVRDGWKQRKSKKA